MLTDADQLLIDRATRLIASLPDSLEHTVAAVIRDVRGNVSEGVNLFHFTGGPCAEPVALAMAALRQDAEPELIVAVGNHNRGVLAPCGRCRQILVDYFPGIDVLVPLGVTATRVSIRELLPYGYSWHQEQPK